MQQTLLEALAGEAYENATRARLSLARRAGADRTFCKKRALGTTHVTTAFPDLQVSCKAALWRSARSLQAPRAVCRGQKLNCNLDTGNTGELVAAAKASRERPCRAVLLKRPEGRVRETKREGGSKRTKDTGKIIEKEREDGKPTARNVQAKELLESGSLDSQPEHDV